MSDQINPNNNNVKPSLNQLKEKFQNFTNQNVDSIIANTNASPEPKPHEHLKDLKNNLKSDPKLPLKPRKRKLLLALGIMSLFLLLSLGLNLISFLQLQALKSQNQEAIANLSKRLGLTETEVKDLNQPVKSPTEIVQTALNSIIVIEKKIPAETMEEIRKISKDQYIGNPEDKEAIDQAANPTDLWEQLGSGIILDSNGTILTNKHIVATSGEYRIKTERGDTFPLSRTMLHPYEDLAIVEIDQEKADKSKLSNTTFTPIEIETRNPQSGDEVYALGHPSKLSYSVTKGVVSNPDRNFLQELDNYLDNIRLPEILRRAYFTKSGQASLLPLFLNSELSNATMLQHSAAINLGSSGGAIINSQGKLIGLNTFGIQRQDTETYNLAPNLENPFSAVNGFDDIENKVIQGYTPGSDFNSNGAIKAEVISQVWSEYQSARSQSKPLAVPYLGLYVNSYPKSQAAFWGLPIQNGMQITSQSDRLYGFDLAAVDPNGPAKDSGLKEGDIISAVDSQALNFKNNLGKVLSEKKPGDQIEIEYYRLDENKNWNKSNTKLTLGSLNAWNEESLKNLKLGSISL